MTTVSSNPSPPRNEVDAVAKVQKPTSKSAAKQIKKDAAGQFVRRKSGGDKDGLHSAKPVAVTGKRDATFKGHWNSRKD